MRHALLVMMPEPAFSSSLVSIPTTLVGNVTHMMRVKERSKRMELVKNSEKSDF